jgi:DNA-binding NarL/FixJ family response regulator
VRLHTGDVVVVDDDDAFRTLLIDVLERAGYKAAGAARAEEALVAISEDPPDIVITDVQLPGLSGYELCRQLKDTYDRKVAVIIISGERTEPLDRAAGIFLGADDYMIKPVDPSELLARVSRFSRRVNGDRAGPANGASGKLAVLSRREREVLGLLAGGCEQDEIAQALFISPKTVGTHIQRTLTKLGVHSRTQAVVLALRQE